MSVEKDNMVAEFFYIEVHNLIADLQTSGALGTSAANRVRDVVNLVREFDINEKFHLQEIAKLHKESPWDLYYPQENEKGMGIGLGLEKIPFHAEYYRDDDYKARLKNPETYIAGTAAKNALQSVVSTFKEGYEKSKKLGKEKLFLTHNSLLGGLCIDGKLRGAKEWVDSLDGALKFDEFMDMAYRDFCQNLGKKNADDPNDPGDLTVEIALAYIIANYGKRKVMNKNGDPVSAQMMEEEIRKFLENLAVPTDKEVEEKMQAEKEKQRVEAKPRVEPRMQPVPIEVKPRVDVANNQKKPVPVLKVDREAFQKHPVAGFHEIFWNENATDQELINYIIDNLFKIGVSFENYVVTPLPILDANDKKPFVNAEDKKKIEEQHLANLNGAVMVERVEHYHLVIRQKNDPKEKKEKGEAVGMGAAMLALQNNPLFVKRQDPNWKPQAPPEKQKPKDEPKVPLHALIKLRNVAKKPDQALQKPADDKVKVEIKHAEVIAQNKPADKPADILKPVVKPDLKPAAPLAAPKPEFANVQLKKVVQVNGNGQNAKPVEVPPLKPADNKVKVEAKVDKPQNKPADVKPAQKPVVPLAAAPKPALALEAKQQRLIKQIMADAALAFELAMKYQEEFDKTEKADVKPVEVAQANNPKPALPAPNAVNLNKLPAPKKPALPMPPLPKPPVVFAGPAPKTKPEEKKEAKKDGPAVARQAFKAQLNGMLKK